MIDDLNDTLSKAVVVAWQTAQSTRPHDPIALADTVDAFVSQALDQLRVRLVAAVGSDGAASLQRAIAQSAVADYKRRDPSRMLPAELVLAILDHCGWDDLANAGRVNRALFEASQKLLALQPKGTIRLSMLPHHGEHISTQGAVPSNYASSPVQAAHNPRRWSMVHPTGVQLLRREGNRFLADAAYTTERHMEAQPRWMRACAHAWHPDGTHFATVGWVGDAPKVHIVAVQDAEAASGDGHAQLRAVRYLPLMAAEENAQLCWSSSQPHLLAVSSDLRTQIFDVTREDNTPVCQLPPQQRAPELDWRGTPLNPPKFFPQFLMSWSPTAPVLCTADTQGALALWDLTDLAKPVALPLPALPVDDYSVAAWHPTGSLLCYATQDTVAIVRPGNATPLFKMASKDLLEKFPGGGANCVWVQTRSSTDHIHAAWEPQGHPYLAIARAGSLLIAHWDGSTLTPIRWQVGGIGTGACFRWSEPDTLEMLLSGSNPGLWRVQGKGPKISPRPIAWTDGALGTRHQRRDLHRPTSP